MERRDFLRVSLTGLGAVAAFFGSIPFVKSFLPSAKAKALGNPIEIDLSQIEPFNRLVKIMESQNLDLSQVKSIDGLVKTSEKN